MEPLRGSCLCGGVRFELTRPFRRAGHCHCSRCRRHGGGDGLAQGRVPRDGFRLLAGGDLLRVYRPGDGAAAKVFCSACGSSVFGGDWPDGDEVSVRLGALDGEPPLPPQDHAFTASLPAWVVLPADGLPRHPGSRPAA
ncbi:MAG TPA: GFA family protein [Gaiellaceae bacterium]|nr:GFA family protein [Gaiellaceae bacterium]